MSAVGSVLALSHRLGSYELIRLIAQGGMADIYLARRVGPGRFERHVAVKVSIVELEQVIRTALATDPARRFASAQALIEALERVAIARGWASGTGAIQRTMHGLFGDVPEPWTSCADDAPVTEPHSVVSLPRIAEPTRPARRLARGTESDCFGDDLDERTRGRAPLRRCAAAVRGSPPERARVRSSSRHRSREACDFALHGRRIVRKCMMQSWPAPRHSSPTTRCDGGPLLMQTTPTTSPAGAAATSGSTIWAT
jgi:hypothetical protein